MTNSGTHLNKKWTYQGHTLEIRVADFVIDEIGNTGKGLRGTMDGQVKQWSVDMFKADWTTFCYIENVLELHASGKW